MKVAIPLSIFVIIFKLTSAISTEFNITTNPQSQSACPGAVVHFNCQLTGTDVLPNWRINGKEYAPSTLPPSYYPGPNGLTVHVVQSHNVSFQCLLFYIAKSGLPVLVSSGIAYLNILSSNFILLYPSTFTLEDPTIEQFYVKNGQLKLKWSENEMGITKYNIVLYTDGCTNNNTIKMVGGETLETTIPVENLTKKEHFYLRIQACSNSICSSNRAALYITDIEDPALQLSTVTINVNNSIVCFNTSIRDKCGVLGTVKINNIPYVLNSNANVNRKSYYAYPFNNNSWMEYRQNAITKNVELCITNISNFLSEFLSKQKFIININDQCSKSKDCSAINRSLSYLEIGFQRILDIEENVPLPSVSSSIDSKTVSITPFSSPTENVPLPSVSSSIDSKTVSITPSPTDNISKCECTKSPAFIAPLSVAILLLLIIIIIIILVFVCYKTGKIRCRDKNNAK